MTKIEKKFFSAIATGSLLLGSISSTIFGATYEITGNGRDSESYINVEMERETEVEQKNEADVDNKIKINANSGYNKIKDSTGAEVEIDTGDVEVGVAIENSVNTNAAEVDTCGGCGMDGEFKIADNARDTDNDIKFEFEHEVELEQDNEADVDNEVDITATSGDNKVKDTTNGSVTVDTGKVTVNPVMIKNTLNMNMASVKGANDEGELSVWITGNARDSENYADLEYESEIELEQDNEADVDNDVDLLADSGWNKVKDSTGGYVEVDTGEIEVGVLLDTMANFNMADVEDCCMLDLMAKIANNGRDTANDIKLELEDELEVEQENEGDFDNEVDLTAESGENKVKDSTLGGDDPSIDTGPVSVGVEVMNSGDVNTYGEADFDLPGGDTSVDIDIDFGGLIELLEELLALLS
jgi:hypothetical protein